MSLKEWKMVYYPTPTEETSEEDALDHSIRKWEGLTSKVRHDYSLTPIRYDVSQPWARLEDENQSILCINGSTCALCEIYHVVGDGGEDICIACPIVRVTGESCAEAWWHFVETGEAEPMIELLKATKEGL